MHTYIQTLHTYITYLHHIHTSHTYITYIHHIHTSHTYSTCIHHIHTSVINSKVSTIFPQIKICKSFIIGNVYTFMTVAKDEKIRLPTTVYAKNRYQNHIWYDESENHLLTNSDKGVGKYLATDVMKLIKL